MRAPMTIEEKVGRAIVIQARMKLQECPPEAREAALLFVIRELRKLLGEPARSPSAAMKFQVSFARPQPRSGSASPPSV